MTDKIIKQTYYKVKELFTQTENPLYQSFYNDEENGFNEFKKHFLSDETLKWTLDVKDINNVNTDYIAREIVYKINRLYYMSRQSSK